MNTATADGSTLFYDESELDTAELVRETCARTARLLRERWALPAPRDCRVYVMTSWRRFLFHAAPWSWRIMLGLTYPLWARSVARTWEIAGGWAQAFGDRRAVGVKPARLMRRAGGGLGQRIFLEVTEDDEKVRHVTCHELTHGFTEHLRLPHWLKEGLAMVAVDRLTATTTVRPETCSPGEGSPAVAPSVKSLRRLGPDDLVALYLRGYWTTRFLDEQQPELLRSLLERRLGAEEIEARMSEALDLKSADPWPELDAMVSSHFAARPAGE